MLKKITPKLNGVYQKLFHSSFQKIGGAALLLAVASLTSRLLGVLRDRILAGTFGAGDELDIYYAAFRFPDLIFNLVVMGVLSAGFIPVFSRLFHREGEKKAWELANSVLNTLFLVLIIFSLLLVILAPWLMRFLTPGFSPEKLQMAVLLTRLMSLSPLFLGLSAVLGNVLQSLKKFFTYALAPILYNLGIIFGALVLVDHWGLKGLAWGVVFGALLHFLIQIPSLIGTGFHYRFFFGWAGSGLKEIWRLTVPRTLSLVLLQLNFLFITAIASWLEAGSLAIFNLAYNIWSFPLGVFATSLVVASFPVLAEKAGQDRWEEFKQGFVYTFRQILFYLIPASALFIVLRAQLVRVILGSGKFNWRDTILTINSLKFLTLGLLAEGLILLLTRTFFVLRDAKTPFFVGLLGTLARVGGAWYFSLKTDTGTAGLALGFALGAVLQMGVLWFFLEKKIRALQDKEIFISGLKIITASFLAGVAAWLGLRLGAHFVDMQTGLGVLLQGTVAGLFGILVYLVSGTILKLKETKDLSRALFERFSLRRIRAREDISGI